MASQELTITETALVSSLTELVRSCLKNKQANRKLFNISNNQVHFRAQDTGL